jgi:hypothetical protein
LLDGLNQSYNVFNSESAVFISGDGLSVSGFNKQTMSLPENPTGLNSSYRNTVEDFDVRITLAEIPTLGLVKTGERVVLRYTNQYSDTTTNFDSVTVTPGCGADPMTLRVEATDLTNSTTLSGENTIVIGYLNGALRSVRDVGQSLRLASVQRALATWRFFGPDNCTWDYVQSKGESIDKYHSDSSLVFSNGALISSISDKSEVYNTFMAPPNSKWDHLYMGPAPGPQVQYTPVPNPVVYRLYRIGAALTDRVEDAIYTVQITKDGPWATRFRNNDITDKWYVADGSPIGEVFFATTDLSVIVHEPMRGPKIVIPPNVVKLLAAIWM